MANATLLKQNLKASGKKKSHLAAKANVSRPRLNYILDHPETATYGQASALSSELNFDSDTRNVIFLP